MNIAIPNVFYFSGQAARAPIGTATTFPIDVGSWQTEGDLYAIDGGTADIELLDDHRMRGSFHLELRLVGSGGQVRTSLDGTIDSLYEHLCR